MVFVPLSSFLLTFSLDNSEYMRNGDFTPTRLSAQHDAVNLIAEAKTSQNPESAVGILTMGGEKGLFTN